MNTKLVAAGGITAFLFLGAASCDKITEPYKDGPRSGTVNKTPADVIEMPDGFSNLATKCDHGNRIYVAFHGNDNRAAVTVVANDSTCSGS